MEKNSSKKSAYLPLYFALILIIGVFIGRSMYHPISLIRFFPSAENKSALKISEIINYLNDEYVDTVNDAQLTEEAINAMLQKLDPHSIYIPADELQSVNESLEGNFDGIGVEFNIFRDTILVVSPVSGGPSEQVGILSGDRIIQIENKNVAGIGISNKEVMHRLRGPGGTKVNVAIKRYGRKSPLAFTITRGKIPIYSMDAAYMVNREIGYIKINRFAETTFDEYKEAFADLQKKGMKKLILDLRNNPGGYLKAATMIADEFLEDGRLIVYTQGRVRPKSTYKASRKGDFEKGALIILIDEGSASASEIVAGAIQDWDRGTIIGRRSFGKGLVQDQTILSDSSALRLTIARYYTPSGRCIQKSYREGKEAYNMELERRMQNGEMENKDSIRFPDSLIYKTMVKNRTVYGGGGIMPDVFVPLDTTMNSMFLGEVLSGGLINQFVIDFTDKNRSLFAKYKTLENFRKNFVLSDEIYKSFVTSAIKSIKHTDESGVKSSAPLIKNQIKALIARAFWKSEGYYSVINDEDPAFKKAVEIQGL